MDRWLGITLGDPAGVGPEVALKALAQVPDDGTRYLLIGSAEVLGQTASAIGSTLKIEPFRTGQGDGRFFSFDPLPETAANPEIGSAEAARSALAALRDAARRCSAGELAGMITAPVSKEAILNLGQPFTGQTEYLSELAGAERTAMMLLGKDDRERWLRVALVTTHLPLKEVAGAITGPKVKLAIELAARACTELGLGRAKVGVCGLNPHAGEGGYLGREEVETIAPAVQEMIRGGYDIEGPLPADTLFYYAYNGYYDAVVAMYHDQGLAPLKMIGFESGINWTLGLPFVRTSPDHGTAYNIAGQNKANPGSMLAAINLARQLTSTGKPSGL